MDMREIRQIMRLGQKMAHLSSNSKVLPDILQSRVEDLNEIVEMASECNVELEEVHRGHRRGTTSALLRQLGLFLYVLLLFKAPGITQTDVKNYITNACFEQRQQTILEIDKWVYCLGRAEPDDDFD